MTDIQINNAFFLSLFGASGLLLADGVGRLLPALPGVVGAGQWMTALVVGV